jgi:hypothetical protein
MSAARFRLACSGVCSKAASRNKRAASACSIQLVVIDFRMALAPKITGVHEARLPQEDNGTQA